MKRAAYLLTFLLGACGAQSAPPATDAAGEDCRFEPDDPCISEEGLEQCRARSAECPGEVLILESCPIQVRCP